MLNSFYKYTFIVFWTINASIYLGFRVFDTIFNYLNYIEKIITNYSCSLREIILKACKKASTKVVKYYLKIEELNKMLYNFVNILDSTQKLNFYKI